MAREKLTPVHGLDFPHRGVEQTAFDGKSFAQAGNLQQGGGWRRILFRVVIHMIGTSGIDFRHKNTENYKAVSYRFGVRADALTRFRHYWYRRQRTRCPSP